MSETRLTTPEQAREKEANFGGPATPQRELIATSQDTSLKNQPQANKMAAKRLAQFYQGKTVFITGATGFIGKVCLLKLMGSLGVCKRVYVVLRSKKGLTPQQRFNKMLTEAPFNPQLMQGEHLLERVRDLNARNLEKIKRIDWSKVVPIEGDMACEDLGLDEDTKRTLCQEVDIVFNIAASVQFDAPLKQNLRDNYLGCRNLLDLATKFERLISLVHVSTFYSNSHLPHIEEKVVPMDRDCEKMAELISWVPDSLLETMAPQIMEHRPNTYIFTKAMSENLIQKYRGQLPIAIVRPSIVVPSKTDPEPGWVDNVNGPMGLGTLAALGILRNIDWNYWGICDFIPVDYVVNSMLAIAERTVRLQSNDIKVYNCSTSSENPVTWGKCFEVLREESLKAPPYKMLRMPITVPQHRRASKIGMTITKLSELFFAYLIDFLLVICGQKRLLTRLTSKLHHGYDLLRPFTTNEYTCSNDNLIAAFEEMDSDDQSEFEFNLKSIDWEENFRHSYYGARRRLLKEPLDNVPAALFKMRIMRAVELCLKLLTVVIVGWSSLKTYSLFNNQVMVSV